jgi:predicted dehydrogenase
MPQRFAVIGLDHRHAYDLAAYLIEAGMECAGYWPVTTDQGVLDGFRRRFPDLPEVAERERLLDDPSINVIVTAAVPKDRAPLAVEAMRRGKDVMADKPGITTFEQLAQIEAAVRETGRIFSICFSERFLTPSTEMALSLVRAGAIGRVVQSLGTGPHRLNRAIRPGWFWERDAYGGILVDIASHQIDQFLAFTDSQKPTVAMALSLIHI